MLSKRLNAIAELVPFSQNLVDVGTDHGFIPVYLIKNGLIEHAIATDISPGSLKKAQNIIEREGLGDKIETRLGSGLSVVKAGEADAVIIAGMGGMLIKDILEDGKDVAEQITTFILQPMVAQHILRKWLLENGYAIVDEILVKEEDRFYEIIVAAHGEQKVYEDIYYEIGYKLIEKQDPLLEAFILKKIQNTEDLIRHLKLQNTSNARKRMHQMKKKLTQYRRIHQWDVKSKRL